MAKSERVILFLSAEAGRSEAAAALFAQSANRLGLSWSVRASDIAVEAPLSIVGVSVLVYVDLDSFGIGDWEGRVERLSSADGQEGVNRLLSRLLGGDDAARAPAAPAPPAPPKKLHTVKVSRETAGRRGKGVTIVSDLPLTGDQLKELATRLKNACGTGGTAKDGRIEIQGDLRDRVAAELEKLGYKVKRAGG